MSLRHEDDAQPTLQVSPGALLSDQPRPKETKKDKRKGVGLSLGRKPRDQGTEKITKKGKHVRNKSGSRTPPDSPRAERGARGGKGQPSPNVKSHRKRYSQLGLDLSSADSEGEEEEEQTYFTNQAATEEVTADSHSQEPFFSIEKDNVSSDQPTSPVLKSTVHFPVQFGEGGTTGFPVTAFEPQPPHPRLPQPLSEPTPPSPTSPPPFFPHPTQPFQNPGPWIVPLPSAPLSDLPVCTLEVGGSLEVADLTPDLVVERDQGVPEAEWRISNELRLKCKRQFVELQPTHGRLQGDQARTFFIQSRLPNADLSAIWRLSDMDGDNALSEQEFCVAMKLVLLRRKGYSLPSTLPHSLKESIAGDDHSNTIPPALASQSVMELTPVEPNTSFSEPEANVVHQQSAPQLNISGPSDADTSNSSTLVEREEPVVANIIFFAGEEMEEESDERTEFFTEKPTHPPPQPSVRRAKSLKHFTPPPVSNHNSPPPSPFSPPAASERVPIINTEKPTPKVRRSKEKLGYHTLSATDEEGGDEGHAAEQLAIGKERGHGRSTSLDLKKMIPSSDVYSDMPAAEPPRPPPKPVADDPDLLPQVRGRSASTGSISSTGPSVPPSSIDASTDALLLPGISRPVPARKAPLLPPVPKPRRPPPPRPEVLAKQNNLLRNKAELQTTIRSLKDTNATLRALNRELEEKLFGLMEDRVQLAQEVELARQMQTSA